MIDSVQGYQKVIVELCISLVIITCITFFSGCVDRTDNSDEQNITIGIILPLSGDLSDFGQNCLNATLLAVEEINQKGGIASKGGKKLEIIIADSKGVPDIGANETKRLITEEKALALIGAYQSSVTIAATQVAETYNVPFIVNTGISDVIIDRGFQCTFRISPDVETYSSSKVQFLDYLRQFSKKPINRVALLYENTAYGTASAFSERDLLKKAGYEVVSDVSYAADKVTSLHDEVNRTLHAEPDAIFITTYLKDAVLIQRELSNAGFSGPVIDTAGGTISEGFIHELGGAANGIFSVSEFSKHTSYGVALNERYCTQFGTDITGDGAYTYQAVIVLKDALERAESLDTESIKKAIAKTNIISKEMIFLPDDAIAFDSDGQNSYEKLSMMQIQNGTWITVWPARYAGGEVILPKLIQN